MTEFLILCAAAFAVGLCWGRWLSGRRETRRSIDIYNPSANIISSIPYTRDSTEGEHR